MAHPATPRATGSPRCGRARPVPAGRPARAGQCRTALRTQREGPRGGRRASTAASAASPPVPAGGVARGARGIRRAADRHPRWRECRPPGTGLPEGRAAAGGRGAGRRAPPSAELPQPGWLHVDGLDGAVTKGSVLRFPGAKSGCGPAAQTRTWTPSRARSETAARPSCAAAAWRKPSGPSVRSNISFARARHPARFGCCTRASAGIASANWWRSAQQPTKTRRRTIRCLVTTPPSPNISRSATTETVTPLVPLPSLPSLRGRNLILLGSEEQASSPIDQALKQRTLQALRSPRSAA